MKIKLTWTAQNQGRRETIIDADNVPGAEEQLKALYGNIPNFVCLGVNIITEPRPNQELPTHTEYINEPPAVDTSSWGIREFALYPVLCFSIILGIVGLITLPFGIILIVAAVLLWKGSEKTYMKD
jgi:hypothetical protein